jgi:hypothetical protein
MSKIDEMVKRYTEDVVSEGDRSIYTIAGEIQKDWAKVNYAAKPYLDAMHSLDSIKDKFYYDSGSSVIAYFLANAQSWRGVKAKEIKKELNKMLKASYK